MKLWTIILIFTLSATWASDLSYHLIDLESSKVVETKNPDTSYPLASVSKIFSTYFLMNHMNLNDNFMARFGYTGKIENGVLKGNLIITSDGDPFFTVQNLLSAIAALRNEKIQKVEGKFIVYPTIEERSSISNLGLEDQADNSSLGPFNIEFNRFLYHKQTKRTIPELEGLIVSEKRYSNDGQKFHLIKSDDTKEVWHRNTLERISNFEELPTKSASLFSGRYFSYLAKLHGINLPPVSLQKEIPEKIFYTHKSLPLYRYLELGLEYSNNLISEMLLIKSNHKADDVLSWYKKNFPDLDWTKTDLQNASGLSLKNVTTAKTLTGLLSNVSDKMIQDRSLISFLSISGHSGGLRKRLKHPDYAHRVYAKTGSLFYVNNLAGYLISKSGRRFAFSIFSTDRSLRNKLNSKNSPAIDKIRSQAKEWSAKSTREIDKILIKWINTL